jgi:hypothetical protein
MKRLRQIAVDLRISRRFTPAYSVSAAVLDGDFHVMQGVVSNISEVGASLVTDRFVNCGPDIMLKLIEQNHGLFETKARIVWQGDGMAPDKEIVGALLGVSFLEVSPNVREKIRDLYLLPDVDFSCSQKVPASNGVGSNGNGANGRGSNGNGGNSSPVSGHIFDLLIDPAIDQLFLDEPGDRERELAEIRQKMQPYLL